MKRRNKWLCVTVIMISVTGITLQYQHQQVTAQDANNTAVQQESNKDQNVVATTQPATITIPNYNYQSFEGMRAAALNAGLFLCQNQINAAFAILQQSSLMNPTQMSQLKEKVSIEYQTIITKQYGGSQGPEIIDEQRKGDHLYRIVMIDRRRVRPVFWELIYYKTENRWRLINIRYHVNLQEAFD